MLIVETGAGLSNSDSYASLADTDTYHANRGNVAWMQLPSDTAREQCLRKATDYITEIYRLRWLGSRVTTTQALDWPRDFVDNKDYKPQDFDNNYYGYGIYISNSIVPNEVKRACMELALRASAGELSPDIQPIGNVIQETVEGAVSVTYSDSQSKPSFVTYRQIDNMLSIYLTNAGTGFTVNRG